LKRAGIIDITDFLDSLRSELIDLLGKDRFDRVNSIVQDHFSDAAMIGTGLEELDERFRTRVLELYGDLEGSLDVEFSFEVDDEGIRIFLVGDPEIIHSRRWAEIAKPNLRRVAEFSPDGFQQIMYQMALKIGEDLVDGELDDYFSRRFDYAMVGGESDQASGNRLQILTPDASELMPQTTPVGGIDLNPALMDLQIKRDGKGIPLPLPQQPIHQMKIDGFLPVIINIIPVPILPLQLGLADPIEEEPTDIGYELPKEPMARKRSFARDEELVISRK